MSDLSMIPTLPSLGQYDRLVIYPGDFLKKKQIRNGSICPMLERVWLAQCVDCNPRVASSTLDSIKIA